MRQTTDVKTQIDFIIREQITCLRARTKSCERIFSHESYDKYTAEYNRLEGELKKLIQPAARETATEPVENISPGTVLEEAPPEEKSMVPIELS